MKKQYDLIFGVGAACSCTQTLRAMSLQLASYPFDWLFGSSFSDRIDILLSGFNRFIDIGDLEYSYSERSIQCNAYHNKFNDITFNHDFLAAYPLEETYPAVKEKYNRRIERLLNKMNEAFSVLIVYIETPDCEKFTLDEDIVRSFDKVKKQYPDKEVDLLYIHIDSSLKSGDFKKEE